MKKIAATNAIGLVMDDIHVVDMRDPSVSCSFFWLTVFIFKQCCWFRYLVRRILCVSSALSWNWWGKTLIKNAYLNFFHTLWHKFRLSNSKTTSFWNSKSIKTSECIFWLYLYDFVSLQVTLREKKESPICSFWFVFLSAHLLMIYIPGHYIQWIDCGTMHESPLPSFILYGKSPSQTIFDFVFLICLFRRFEVCNSFSETRAITFWCTQTFNFFHSTFSNTNRWIFHSYILW